MFTLDLLDKKAKQIFLCIKDAYKVNAKMPLEANFLYLC